MRFKVSSLFVLIMMLMICVRFGANRYRAGRLVRLARHRGLPDARVRWSDFVWPADVTRYECSPAAVSLWIGDDDYSVQLLCDMGGEVRKVMMYGGNYTATSFQSLRRLGGLKTLYIFQDATIDTACISEIGQMPELEDLIIEASLSDIDLHFLSGLENLKSVQLMHTTVQGDGISAIGSLDGLERLMLHSTDLQVEQLQNVIGRVDIPNTWIIGAQTKSELPDALVARVFVSQASSTLQNKDRIVSMQLDEDRGLLRVIGEGRVFRQQMADMNLRIP